MKKFFASALSAILFLSIGIPVIHAHCIDTVSVDGQFLCCYETDEGGSCDQHTPVDTTHEDVLHMTFSPTEKIKKTPTKIPLILGGENKAKSHIFVEAIIFGNDHNIVSFEMLSEKLRAYTKEIKKRE